VARWRRTKSRRQRRRRSARPHRGAPKNLSERVALASGKPGDLKAANPGSDGSTHFGPKVLFEPAGIKMMTAINHEEPAAVADRHGRGLRPLRPDLAEPGAAADPDRQAGPSVRRRRRSLLDELPPLPKPAPGVLEQS
jgi:hypothetical protein